MQCHDGTLDVRAECQQCAVAAPLRRRRLHPVKDLSLWLDHRSGFGTRLDWVIRIGHGSQDTQSS
jgi:hypothetical protein